MDRYEHEAQSANNEQRNYKSRDVAPAKSADDRVAEYTLWLTIFTALLVGVSAWQGYLILRAERGTREALKIADDQARAAAASAKNLLRTTRPFIILQSMSLENFSGAVPQVDLPHGQVLMTVHGTFKNQGTAVGFISEHACEAKIGGSLGDDPLQVREARSHGAHALKQDETFTPSLPLDWVPFDPTPRNNLRALQVWGWVRYTDIHGIRRRSGFAFGLYSFAGIDNFFAATGGPRYWYDVEEEE